MKPLRKLFKYEYVGGGYFRERNVPKGTNAKILHGEQAIHYLYKQLNNEEKKCQHTQE